MKAYIAVTDQQLFRFLRRRPDLEEVNFLRPGGGRGFRALRPGEPFLFKLHSPHHFVVGGGFFAAASRLPSSIAWEIFGEKNGASSLLEMRRRIEKYRKAPSEPHQDYAVGCIILQRPFFFDESDWIPAPRDFSKSIVQGKTYDTGTPVGRALWEAVRLRLQATTPVEESESQSDMFGEPVLIHPRLGPGAFRVLVLEAYGRRCAISGEPSLPALEAAHIRPLDQGGLLRVDNGLLLRSDLRRLLDSGYLTVTPEHRVRVSGRLERDFPGGVDYLALDGREILLPDRPEERPRREFLAWHGANLFRG